MVAIFTGLATMLTADAKKPPQIRVGGNTFATRRELIEAANNSKNTILPNQGNPSSKPRKGVDAALNYAALNCQGAALGTGFGNILTGTYVAFPAANQKFGSTFEYVEMFEIVGGSRVGCHYECHIVDLPAEARGQGDIAFAFNHGFLADGTPNFAYAQDGKYVLDLIRGPITVIDNFPRAPGGFCLDGWYLVEPKFGIPVGPATNAKSPGARFLRAHSGGVDHPLHPGFANFIVRSATGDGGQDSRRTLFLKEEGFVKGLKIAIQSSIGNGDRIEIRDPFYQAFLAKSH